jgi:hypothetical protein
MTKDMGANPLGSLPSLSCPDPGSVATSAATTFDAPSSSALVASHAALESYGPEQLKSDEVLLEQLNAILGPLRAAARAEVEQRAACATLAAARQALHTPSTATSSTTSPSLFARLAGGGWSSSSLPGGSAAAVDAAGGVRFRLGLAEASVAPVRALLCAAHQQIDELLDENATLRSRLLQARSEVPFDVSEKLTDGIALEPPLPPPSLARAQSMLGVSSALLKWAAEEPSDSLRKQELRGVGLSLDPSGGAARSAAAEAVFYHARRASKAAAAKRSTKAMSKRKNQLSERWTETLTAAASAIEYARIGGSAPVADPEFAMQATGARVSRGKLKQAAKLWEKVAKMALPGRWSPRPEERGPEGKAAHVGWHADGFPSLADPFGLMPREDDEEEGIAEEEEEEDDWTDEEEDASEEVEAAAAAAAARLSLLSPPPKEAAVE